MKYSEFVNKYKIGKSYAYNGTYKGQCVSLVKLYIKQVLGVTPISIGDAKYYWSKRTGSYLSNIFTPVEKGPAIPGDVFVRTSGTYGHVGIVTKADANGFDTFEQNHGGCLKITREHYAYADNFKFLRPINRKNIDVNKPAIKVGQVVTFNTQPYCYKDNKAKAKLLVRDVLKINPLIESNLNSNKRDETARYKLNTRVTVKAVKELSDGTIMIKSPTCWLKAYSGTKDKCYIY